MERTLGNNYTILHASNGKEALGILQVKQVDVVLSDIVMPKMDGLELLKKIKSNPLWNSVGIIVATSYKEKTEQAALELGADDVISKPYSPWVLKKRIENVRTIKNVEVALKIANDANRAKTEFLSAMSHDIRTPMNAIIGMTDLAIDNIDNQNQVSESLEIIRNSSRHLLSLINDILDMSRIESGKMKLVKNRFSHTKEIANLVERSNVLAQSKNIRFIHGMMIEHDYCIGDTERIHRVLDNIIGNAIKFTPDGGMITLQVEEQKSANKHLANYQFTITDTGIGMSEETVNHMFEPFYRSDEVNESKIEGTGLGMSIVKNTVELAGGTIKVKSTLGEGSTFIVTIPMEISLSKKKEITLEDFHMNYDISGVKILLVEDHPINQQVAEKLLEKEGAVTVVAKNGLEALDIVQEKGIATFDIILMDLQMPVMNGYEATKNIRNMSDEMAKKIPIIAMTANAFNEDVKKCIEAGMNEHLSKPIDPKSLYEVIGKYTGSPLKRTSQPWKQKLLVVDDVEINIAVLEASLSDQFTIISAMNGIEALKQMKNNTDIVAVITDIQMPNMNGLELIKKIREQREYDHIAILANTQYGDVTQEEVILRAGADDFVYKPTTPTIVITRLRNVLKNYYF